MPLADDLWSAQPRMSLRYPGVSLECPTTECPCRVGMFEMKHVLFLAPTILPVRPQSIFFLQVLISLKEQQNPHLCIVSTQNPLDHGNPSLDMARAWFRITNWCCCAYMKSGHSPTPPPSICAKIKTLYGSLEGVSRGY